MNPWHRDFAPSQQPPPCRVVITGLGAVSAAGVGVAPLWHALLDGRSCISEIESFDTEGLPSRIAGEVKNFDPVRLIEPRMKPKRLARQAQFAVVASMEAVCDAKLTHVNLSKRLCKVVLGSSSNNTNEIAEAALQVEYKGVHTLSPGTMGALNMQSQVYAVMDTMALPDASGFTIAGTCTSGIDAMVMGANLIRTGQAEVVICGGTDSPISRTSSSMLIQAGICSERNGEPDRASRPFDRERDNGLMAEGAGIVVLERRDHVLNRGGRYYAEWLGSDSNRDAAQGPVGNGLQRTMQRALQNARCKISEVDYISAWGCGDRTIDRMETQAIKHVFGPRAYDIGISSIKAVTGNPLAASGALQVVAGTLSFRDHLLPPTANYESTDPECDLDYIADEPRNARPRHILINVHGQGGGNTCVVIGPSKQQ